MTIATHRLTELGPSAEIMHDADPEQDEAGDVIEGEGQLPLAFAATPPTAFQDSVQVLWGDMYSAVDEELHQDWA